MAPGAESPSLEYKVKAAFLYNFAKFIEWPKAAFADDEAPLVFAIVGPDPFQGALDQALRDKTVGGRPISIRHFASAAEVQACHILFSSGDKDETSKVIERVKGCPIVTVGEEPGFTRSGGMFRLFTERGKVRFEVNVDAARRAGLTISVRLIQVGIVVKDGEGRR